MRLRRFLPLFLLGVASACSSDSRPKAAATATQRREVIAQLQMPIAEPVLLDSTADVLYPLPLHELATEEASGYGSSSSYGREDTYWNILFYNTRSGASHLLDTSRRLNIKSYRVPHAYGNTVNGAEEASHPQKMAGSRADQLIFYSIITTDTNRDGELTSGDPTYIFTSDKTGKDFRQISPDSLHVSGWDIQQSTGRVLLQTVRDTDQNHQFNNDDETIPYLYDPATGQPARRIFTPAVVQQLRAAFQSKWKKTPAR